MTSVKVALDSWLLWAVLSAVFAAMTAVFGKIGVDRIHPDFATLIRTAVILAFIAGLVLWTGVAQPFSTVPPRTLQFIVLSGLATGLSWLCYYRALKLGQAAQVAPIDKLSVIMVAIFGVAFLGEKLTLKNWAGVALIAGGALLAAAKR